MRDYAKKSFKPAPVSPMAAPSHSNLNTPSHTAGKNNWQFWGITLAVVLGGLLTAQMIYKHVHQEHLNQLNTATNSAPIKTLPTANPTPAAPPKPVFDFYNMLPKQHLSPNNSTTTATPSQVQNTPAPILTAPSTLTPSRNNNAAPIESVSENVSNQNATPVISSPAATPSTYTIQVAAYRNKETARSMQARLFLLGLHPNLTSENGWYRVTLGPYNNLNTAKNIRHKLQNARINGADIKANAR